jgi:hypothetical protein
MTRIFLAALALSLAARAEDTRLEAYRVDDGAAAVPAPSAEAARSDEAPPRSPVLQAPERSDGFRLPVHFGAMVGLSVPRPIDGEVYVRAFGFFQAGFSYSDFPAFVADPLLSAAGLKSGPTQVRLDDFSAMEADLRVYPFAGSLFVGASFGRQSFKSTVTQSTTLGNYQGSVAVSTTFATPRIGYQWTVGPGIVVGADAGVQLALSSSSQKSLPSGAPPEMQSQADHVIEVFGSYPLPSVHLRLGWQY